MEHNTEFTIGMGLIADAINLLPVDVRAEVKAIFTNADLEKLETDAIALSFDAAKLAEFIRNGRIDLQNAIGKYIYMHRVSPAQTDVVHLFLRVYDAYGDVANVDAGYWDLATQTPMAITENGTFVDASGTTAANDHLAAKWLPIFNALLKAGSVVWGSYELGVYTLPTQHSSLVRDAWTLSTNGEPFAPKFRDERYWAYLTKQAARKTAKKARRNTVRG